MLENSDSGPDRVWADGGVINSLEHRLETIIAATPLTTVAAPARIVRFIEFVGVGASGAVVDLSVTLSSLSVVHYLVANLLGFAVAVTWNFGWNWLLTFDRPAGSIGWQFGSYVAVHSVTFGARALFVAALVELGAVDAAVATVLAVLVVSIVNYLAAERIFEGLSDLFPS